MFLKWHQAALSCPNVVTESYSPLSLRLPVLGLWTLHPSWGEKKYLSPSWSSYFKSCFTRSLWCSGSALPPWVMTPRSSCSSSTLALLEGEEITWACFVRPFPCDPWALLSSVFFSCTDSAQGRERHNYSDVFIFVFPVPTNKHLIWIYWMSE